MIRIFLSVFIFLTFSTVAASEDIHVSVSIVKSSEEKTEKLSGTLVLKNFPKTIANKMSFPAILMIKGKALCSGKIRTQGYDAYFSSKCDGQSYRGNSSINRTIKIAGRTINFIRKVKLKSGNSYIEITTGNVAIRPGARNSSIKKQVNVNAERKKAAANGRKCYICDGVKMCMNALEYSRFAGDAWATCKPIL